MTVAMENVKEWSGVGDCGMARMILEASYWALIIQTSYSSNPDSVTALSLRCLPESVEEKLFSGVYFKESEICIKASHPF